MFVEKLREHYERDEATVQISGQKYILTLKDSRELELCEGMTTDESLVCEIERRALQLRCMKKALSAVARTNISRKRLYYKLKRDFGDEVPNTVLDKLEKIGYLNDLESAARYAELYSRKHYGKARIAAELYKKGFTREDIDIAIEALCVDEKTELENMRILLDKKFFNKAFDRNKAYTYLRNKGYSGSVITKAINEYADETEFDDFEY